MAITTGDFSSSFAKGLGDTSIDTSSGVAQEGQSDLNARITAVATGDGVPVDNGQAKSGS